MTDVVTPNVTPTDPVSQSPQSVPAEPNPNMTGAEAKAWVEAQKAKEAVKSTTIKEAARDALGKFMGKNAPAVEEKGVEAEAAPVEKRKLKISDQEEIDEEEALKIIRSRKEHQREANKRFQEGMALRKQAEQFIEMMRDPKVFFDAAAKLGHNPRELTEKFLASQLEEELLPPEQRKIKELQTKLSTFEQKEKEAREAQERKAHEELTEKYRKQYNEQFVKALTDSNLPQTRETVAAMAAHIARAARLKMDITPAEAALLVEEDLRTQHSSIYRNADPAALIKLLGDDTMKKIREYDVNQIKNPGQFLKTPSKEDQPSIRQKQPTNRRMSPKEWREFNRR